MKYLSACAEVGRDLGIEEDSPESPEILEPRRRPGGLCDQPLGRGVQSGANAQPYGTGSLARRYLTNYFHH